jgi:peptidoglycan hydrolase-like protein with peptidoglycan-binding domain
VRRGSGRAGRGGVAESGRAGAHDGASDGAWAIAGWRRWDVVAVTLAILITGTILVNVLFLQSGPHPAPMFKGPPTVKPAATATKPAVLAESPAPRPRPAEPVAAPAAAPAKAVARTPGEIINDIQRELARRGYYDGGVDGLYGPKTDGAIRDFEQANGLKPSTEPSETLLAAIVKAPAKGAARTAAVRPPAAVRNEVERPAPSKRVIALQRALADYGYGQLRPSGIVDAETQSAIEKFERERRLPVTGQPSDRVLRELAAMTGRPLD